MMIDNGNHLLLSGNRAALGYLDTIGARDRLIGPSTASFPFIDLATGERWTLRANDGRMPWWIFDRNRRVPGTRARDYLSILRLLRAAPGATIGDVLDCKGPLYDRLIGPLLLAALNTEPPEGSASLAAAVIRETLVGGRAQLPSADRARRTLGGLRRAGAAVHRSERRHCRLRPAVARARLRRRTA